MIALKITIDAENKALAELIQERLQEECTVNVFDSKGLLASEAVVIAIIAAMPGITQTIAAVVQDYLKRNKEKSVTFENEKGKRTYTGYSLSEIKELESYLREDVKEIK